MIKSGINYIMKLTKEHLKPVWDQVRDQVWDQVYGQVRHEINS